MCGIVGMLGTTFSTQEKKAFQDMLIMNQVRGLHGTGYISSGYCRADSKDGKFKKDSGIVSWGKSVSCASLFLGEHDLEDENTKLDGLIGHCRHATVGNIDKAGAHPFKEGKIVGVHNGTFEGTYPHSKKAQSDSHAFYIVLNEEKGNVERAINRFTKRTTADAYCFVWYDLSNSTWNIIRNTRRPMYLAESYGGGQLWLSSEAPIMMAALKRNKVHLTKQPWEIPPYTHVVVKQGSSRSITSTEIESIKPPVASYVHEHNHAHGGYSYQSGQQWGNYGAARTLASVVGLKSHDRNRGRTFVGCPIIKGKAVLGEL